MTAYRRVLSLGEEPHMPLPPHPSRFHAAGYIIQNLLLLFPSALP